MIALCAFGIAGPSAHAMPIGVRIAMMGGAAATFNESAKDIGLAQVEVDCSDVTYCGTAYEPALQSVKWGDDTLVAGTDYTLAYSNNVNAGVATITLTGTNLYNGTYTTNFTIRPKSLTQGMVASIGNLPYTGAAQTPEPVVTDFERGVTLEKFMEYTLSYANNTAVGEGIVTVTGTWNYTGSINRAFVIEPSEGSELEDIFGGNGQVGTAAGGGWVVKLTNDVDTADLPLEIPDDFGSVTIDLNGHSLLGSDGEDGAVHEESVLPGGDGKPALRIVAKSGDEAPTVLTVITTGGDALVKGGDGGAGNPGGNGAAAIAVQGNCRDGIKVNVGAGVTVRGGRGGDSTAGNGGSGGAGVEGDVRTNDGTIIGGDGGGSESGDGGDGGAGVDGNVDVNNGGISGGDGGESENGADGEYGEGVTGDIGLDNGGIVPYRLKAGEYFKATLAELGYDVPTNGTPYSVVAKGLPAGLKLKYNAAVTKKVKQGKKTKTVVVKPAKVEWWIEGVPTTAVDFFTNPPYLVITANGTTTTEPLPVEVLAQNVTELEDLALGQMLNEQYYLPGVTNGWTVSGLPTGLKYAAKLLTTSKKVGKKTVVTTNALPYSVYGKTTKAGLFTITAKKKVGAYYETMKYRVLVRPKAVDSTVFGNELTNITTMAYENVDWDLTGDGGALGDRALPIVPSVAKVAGLPAGVTFAAKNTYAYANPKKKTGRYLKQSGQTIIGTPTKPGTYVVTFTKNVTTGTGKKKKTVAKTAQILWTVVENDAGLELAFNNAGGVIESGSVGLKYGDLLAFAVTSNATVTASGLPAGIKLAKLDAGDGGALGDRALPGFATYGFTGFTAKAGTYLVTVKATIKGKSVTQRVALKVDALPAWAKGTFNGIVLGIGNGEQGTGNGEQGTVATNGLATVTVSAAGKISGKFHEGGTNWTFSAESYTAAGDDAFICSNVVAKYAYKVKTKVGGKVKTVTKYVSRKFVLRVGAGDGYDGGVAAMEELRLGEDNSPHQDGEGTRIDAWQKLWGTKAYKTLGAKLFYTSAKKPYKIFAVNGATDGGAAIGLTEAETLSLKVTPAGAVTATMSFDTGKTKKNPKTKKTEKVIYKGTCQTVVIPLTAADADPFVGQAFLYFAPSAANGFAGYAGVVPLPF